MARTRPAAPAVRNSRRPVAFALNIAHSMDDEFSIFRAVFRLIAIKKRTSRRMVVWRHVVLLERTCLRCATRDISDDRGESVVLVCGLGAKAISAAQDVSHPPLMLFVDLDET